MTTESISPNAPTSAVTETSAVPSLDSIAQKMTAMRNQVQATNGIETGSTDVATAEAPVAPDEISESDISSVGPEVDDTETAEFGDDGEEESDSEELDMMAENVTLDKAPAPTTSEPAGTNTKSTVAFNSGAKGMQGSPVKMTGDTAQGRPAPKSADLPEAGKFKNVPGKGTANAKLAPAPKPHLAQATGVNTTTPFPKA